MKSSSMASSSERKLANVVGGKTARACDNCARKRARCYCAADDAFLCQSCDSSVHSANPLARRHERVRLKTSSSIPPGFDDETGLNRVSVLPSCCWYKGFTKKARTPRHKKHAKGLRNHPLGLVPEISSEDYSNQENDNEQLLYRVPVFDPFLADFCTSAKPNDQQPLTNTHSDQSKHATSNGLSQEISNLRHFLPSEMDLDEFAADVESLLGTGLEDESFDMESLGLLDSKECISFGTTENQGKKEEEEEEIGLEVAKSNHQNDFELIDMGRETFELSFDYDCEEEDIKPVQIGEPTTMMMNDLGSCNKVDHHESKRNALFLRLDYQGVLSAWDDQKSPWTTGERPELDDSADCWPACMGTCGRIHVYGDMGPMMGGHVTVMADGGREARVSRYREKRRTRLFSKKIRYEVRKLNAEKRPRMKGRFVKRANLVATGLPLLKK